MFPKVVSRLAVSKSCLNALATRSYGVSGVAMQSAAEKPKIDPIQKLYLDKAREYYKKKA